MIRCIRPFILITGTLLCVLITVELVVSAWWSASYGWRDGCFVAVTEGRLLAGYGSGARQGFHLERHDFRLEPTDQPPASGYLWVPLSSLCLTVFVPTGLVALFVPRYPRGYCQKCGTKLSVVTRLACPRCGTGRVFEMRACLSRRYAGLGVAVSGAGAAIVFSVFAVKLWGLAPLSAGFGGLPGNEAVSYVEYEAGRSTLLATIFTVAGVVGGVVAAGAHRRIDRSRRGCCPICGYDLTGNTSGVCPECGVEVQA